MADPTNKYLKQILDMLMNGQWVKPVYYCSRCCSVSPHFFEIEKYWNGKVIVLVTCIKNGHKFSYTSTVTDFLEAVLTMVQIHKR